MVDKNTRNLFTAAAYCPVVAGAQPCSKMNWLGLFKHPDVEIPLRCKDCCAVDKIAIKKVVHRQAIRSETDFSGASRRKVGRKDRMRSNAKKQVGYLRQTKVRLGRASLLNHPGYR